MERVQVEYSNEKRGKEPEEVYGRKTEEAHSYTERQGASKNEKLSVKFHGCP